MSIPDATIPSLLADGSRRLVRTVDGFDTSDWDHESQLPGWTRSTVVAHLALNAEALTGVLEGAAREEPVPMYASQESRDADILELSQAGEVTLRARFLASLTLFNEALAGVPEQAWGGRFERTAGGETIGLGAIPGMRLREVEIHHADLATAYTCADWPEAFSVHLLESMVRRDDRPPLTVHATDLDRTWSSGVDGPVVSGTAADLGWWLTGRGDGATLSSNSGELPRIGAW